MVFDRHLAHRLKTFPHIGTFAQEPVKVEVVHFKLSAEEICVQTGIKKRYIKCASVECDKVAGIVFFQIVHGCIEDLRFLVMVLCQELGDTHAAAGPHQKPYENGLASAAVKTGGFDIQHARLHAVKIDVPFRMIFTCYSVISCKNFHRIDFSLSS